MGKEASKAEGESSELRAVEVMLERFNHLMEQVQALDTVPRDFGTGHALYRAEIHTVQAIGRNAGINLTGLAERMGVTKGAASQVVSKLVRKGLVDKTTAPESGREVRLELTPLGWTGYEAHERFHAQMFEAVKEYFGDSTVRGAQRATRTLRELIGIVETFARRVTRD